MNQTPQTFTLRPYQQDLIESILQKWSEGHRRVLAQSPTGSGKTIISSAIAAEFTARGEGVLVLAHREELITQAADKLQSITAQPVGIIKAGHRRSPNHQIQVASVQSLIRREKPPAGLVVIDEAHHSPSRSYQKILECYPEAYILGVTATPSRTDGKGFPNQYDALVLGWSVRQLIDGGYLCPFRVFASEVCIKAAGLKLTGGDYNQAELSALVNTSLTLGDVVGTWQRHAHNKKTVVFCVDVAGSIAVAEAYRAAGYSAEHLDGDVTQSDRAATLERFRSGETLILSNCSLFTEGLDIPDIEAVQCLRPTRSLVLHLQMVGRGLRSHSGKEHLTIIDHTENWVFHGLPDAEHQWSLDPGPSRQLIHTIQCPDCSNIFNPKSIEQLIESATVCPNCGSVIPHDTDNDFDEDGFSREINHDETASIEEVDLGVKPLILAELQRLKQVQSQHKLKKIWIYHALVKNFPDVGLPELRECAKLLDYKDGWAWYKWLELQQQRLAS